MYSPGELDDLEVEVSQPVVYILSHESLHLAVFVGAWVHTASQEGALVSGGGR